MHRRLVLGLGRTIACALLAGTLSVAAGFARSDLTVGGVADAMSSIYVRPATYTAGVGPGGSGGVSQVIGLTVLPPTTTTAKPTRSGAPPAQPAATPTQAASTPPSGALAFTGLDLILLLLLALAALITGGAVVRANRHRLATPRGERVTPR